MDWTRLADDDAINNAVNGLKKRNIEAIVMNNGNEAREKLLSLIPEGSEVMAVSSTTLDQIGALKDIDESGRYVSLRKKFMAESDPVKRDKLRKSVATSDFAVGSAHAITQNGEIIDASATGSNISYYSYTASKIIMVVGTQKIVKDLDEGLKRVREHTFQLESERMMKAYGRPSSLNKILIIEKDAPGRTTVIFVKEKLGF
jgi:hypothetical protein